jgi:hypothetical protein
MNVRMSRRARHKSIVGAEPLEGRDLLSALHLGPTFGNPDDRTASTTTAVQVGATSTIGNPELRTATIAF